MLPRLVQLLSHKVCHCSRRKTWLWRFFAPGVLSAPISLIGPRAAPQNPRIIFEAAWALTNVASGNSSHTEAAVGAGVVPVFIELLSHDIPEIRDQAVGWDKRSVGMGCPEMH